MPKKPVSRFRQVSQMLRRAWIRDVERYAALAAACRPYVGPNKRQKKEYQCAVCGQWFIQKLIQVDHIIPVGEFTKDEHWATFGPGLFCSRDNLQIICKPCHKIKSNKEKQDRSIKRNEKDKV